MKIIVPALLFILTGCITEYEHPGLKDAPRILVVEGTITNDTTFVDLTYSGELSETIYKPAYVSGASVTVEAENGAVFSSVEFEEGRFYTLTGNLDFTTRYRLKVSLDGRTYVSEFLEALDTPEVTSLDLYKRTAGEDIHILVSTTNTEDGSRFYRWSYEEIWEYSAGIMATSYQVPELNKDDSEPRDYYDYIPYSPYYYCWSFDRSKSLQIASSVNLSENRIERYSIGSYPPNSPRFSILYYVKVKQNCIRKEAYDYFNNLKENTENTGNIFGPVPSEMRGNIVCEDDGNIPVIGYIDVSVTKEFEKFFSSFRDISEYVGPHCQSFEYYQGEYETEGQAFARFITEVEEAGLNWELLTLYYIGGPRKENPYSAGNLLLGAAYTEPKCIDCRSSTGFHDRKPDFWPNNHI